MTPEEIRAKYRSGEGNASWADAEIAAQLAELNEHLKEKEKQQPHTPKGMRDGLPRRGRELRK